MKALQFVHPDDGSNFPIGEWGVYWCWLKDGEIGSGPIDITDAEASEAITNLVRESKIQIKARKGELLLQLSK